MPLLPKCRCKLANGCHESYDSRLHFVCVRCVALHLRDDQLRIKFRKNGQRGHSPCGHFNAGQRGQPPCWQWGQSPCGHSFLTQRGRRVYVVVRSFYRRCFNRFQMSELEIDLELFAVHFALTGSGDSPRVVRQRGQSPCGHFLLSRRALNQCSINATRRSIEIRPNISNTNGM